MPGYAFLRLGLPSGRILGALGQESAFGLVDLGQVRGITGLGSLALSAYNDIHRLKSPPHPTSGAEWGFFRLLVRLSKPNVHPSAPCAQHASEGPRTAGEQTLAALLLDTAGWQRFGKGLSGSKAGEPLVTVPECGLQ